MGRPGDYNTGRDLSEGFQDLLGNLARFLFYAGLLAVVGSLGFLIYYATMPAGQAPPIKQAEPLLATFGNVLMIGTIAVAIGAGYTFWGEEVMPVFQLVGAGLLYFAPLLMQSFGGESSPVGQAALGAIQGAGAVYGAAALIVLVLDLTSRVRERAARGAKADALKYGKGIKEEKSVQNVFMGKCWQLPYCRKFVRERCPIYHSQRTCWKEKVGCMCEEKVIQHAMENRAIPRDVLAAAEYIPRNNKLTEAQKRERCHSCVIYNEHQKHKYKLSMPVILLGFIGTYAAFRTPLLAATKEMIQKLDFIVGRATFQKTGGIEAATSGTLPFQEFLLVCFFVVALAYTMRLAEFLIFKLKV